MPIKNAQTKSAIIRNIIGGLNVRESVVDLADNEGATASNINFYTAGALVRRGGWSKLIANTPTANPLIGIYQAVFNSAGTFTYYLIITDGIKIWQSSNPTATTVTWTEITGGFSLDSTQPYRFLMMAGKMVGYNGKTAFYWTGSGNITAFTNGALTLVIQDLTYTAVGLNPTLTTIAYTTGGTAGSEAVTVSGNTITVQISTGVSTATQVKAAVDGSAAAHALVTVAISGTGATAQTAPVSASYTQTITVPYSRAGIVWQNFLFWGGDGTNPTRLYFSALADPTTYPSANFIDVPSPFDGDQITGLAILYGNLLVFKRFSLYVLQGAPPSNLILSRLNSPVGCVDPYSVVQVDNLVYFVSDRGLYAANLFNVRQVCYKVEPRYLAAIPYSGPANPITAINYKPRSQVLVSINARSLYSTSISKNERIMAHDYINADANGDPAASEFIVGFTHYGLASAKPTYPTAPNVMDNFFYPGNPSKNVTVMASFYDPWVYVFTEGTLGFGGPTDDVSWLSASTYPQTDFLSKFFDAGDPDMMKQVRWLWTTGQLYNNINLSAGIVYNNSPTVVSFVDFNTDIIELRSANGTVFLLGVDDDGALTTTLTLDTTFVKTLILQDANAINWQIGVDNDGALTSVLSTSGTSSTNPVLPSPLGFQYQMAVETNGTISTTGSFAPDVSPIIPGMRVAVLPIVNGIGGARQAKFWQIYFTGIGILSQFSFDLILKGRRN